MNQILDSILIALQAIWANKLRSCMTVLGNVVAVTSIVTVVSLIQGMNAMVSDAIVSDVGADSFTIQRRPPIRSEDDEERTRNNPMLTLEEARAIRSFSPIITSVMAQASRSATVSYRDDELQNISIQGVTSAYSDFSTFTAERGRMMSEVEVERSQPVALIGFDLADRLFGEVNPLEKTVKISGVPFRVVGVSEKKGSFFGNSQDNFAVIPLGAYQKLFGARQSLTLTVKPATTEQLTEAMDDATVALRVSRRLKPKDLDNFGIFTSETILNLYRQVTSGIFAVLVGIVALSLVVGGIVIMNIMLMVVSERTREIGLRKALGARRKDIMSQVLTESITLSTFGGIVGIFLGFLVATAIAGLTPLPARLEPWSVVLGVGITAAVGLFFGAYPASRAAALDPIEALRRE
ncbi:MAG TPA: ABC transporter permease [Vicinamibacterales bacterium]|nr:ABC transporter permease [Vicinamibacterales bacterium]